MRAEIPLVVLDPSTGNAVPGATVYVNNRATAAQATVFQAETGTGTFTQPLATDASGRVQGWLPRGPYVAQITASGFPAYEESFDITPATDGSVDSAWLGTNVVTRSKILDGEVITSKIGDAQVTNAKIADGAITTAKIGDGQIGASKIADGQITSAKIADAAIATVDIADAMVTIAKLAGDAKPGGTAVANGNDDNYGQIVGPWDGNQRLINIPTAGRWLVAVQATAFGTANGVAHLDVNFGGQFIGAAQLYINNTNNHTTFPFVAAVITLAAGNHWLAINHGGVGQAGISSDGNDRASFLCVKVG